MTCIKTLFVAAAVAAVSLNPLGFRDRPGRTQ